MTFPHTRPLGRTPSRLPVPSQRTRRALLAIALALFGLAGCDKSKAAESAGAPTKSSSAAKGKGEATNATDTKSKGAEKSSGAASRLTWQDGAREAKASIRVGAAFAHLARRPDDTLVLEEIDLFPEGATDASCDVHLAERGKTLLGGDNQAVLLRSNEEIDVGLDEAKPQHVGDSVSACVYYPRDSGSGASQANVCPFSERQAGSLTITSLTKSRMEATVAYETGKSSLAGGFTATVCPIVTVDEWRARTDK